MNIVAESTTPIVHANFFCFAPTYSGDWLCTIKRPSIKVGENLGLTKTRIMKSARNRVKTYLTGKKLFLKRINIREMKVAKNKIPAAARISLSFKTGMLWPSAFSPNCMILFIGLFFTTSDEDLTFLNYEEGECRNIPLHTHESLWFSILLLCFFRATRLNNCKRAWW